MVASHHLGFVFLAMAWLNSRIRVASARHPSPPASSYPGISLGIPLTEKELQLAALLGLGQTPWETEQEDSNTVNQELTDDFEKRSRSRGNGDDMYPMSSTSAAQRYANTLLARVSEEPAIAPADMDKKSCFCNRTWHLRDLGMHSFPRYVTYIKCEVMDCWIPPSTCRPINYKVAVLKHMQVGDKQDRPAPLLPEALRGHYMFQMVSLTVGCECSPI